MKIFCGLDEAGRGALAGPLVLAAVSFEEDFDQAKLSSRTIIRDSKKMTKIQRNNAYQQIIAHSKYISVEIIEVDEINEKGIQWANVEGFRRLILRSAAHKYIVDGNLKIPDLGEKQLFTKCVINADATEFNVMAASIVAKVTRDNIMQKLHIDFNQYGWESNSGYGTAKHISALKMLGSCIYHRSLFVRSTLKRVVDV